MEKFKGKSKLVRDFVVSQIRANGDKCEYHVATEAELAGFVLEKIVEESKEVSLADTPEKLLEELADLQEAYQKLLAVKGISEAQVEAARLKKRDRKGGFEYHHILDRW